MHLRLHHPTTGSRIGETRTVRQDGFAFRNASISPKPPRRLLGGFDVHELLQDRQAVFERVVAEELK
jgi:hypothetical protein